MGHELSPHSTSTPGAGILPWLDTSTQALLTDVVATLADACADLRAVLVYGSVARHEERPLSVIPTSDVDLLAIFDSDDVLLSVRRGRALADLLGKVFDRHLDAPREVQVLFASRNLSEWDPTYVEEVARDGIVLFAHGPLPPPLTASSAAGQGRK